MMTKKDFWAGLVIGAGVGLLIQPILANNLPASISLTLAMRIGLFVFFTLLAPLALWIASLIAKLWKGVYQFAQFAAVGTLNSFVDVGVFNLETFLYGSSFIGNVLFAVFKAVSFLFATTNSFLWNKNWTFNDAGEKNSASKVTEFYSVAIVGWVLNVGVATAVKVMGPAGSSSWVNIVAPLGGIAASFAWNFIGYKYFVFKKKAPAAIVG
jgi:putative flippase GtrA